MKDIVAHDSAIKRQVIIKVLLSRKFNFQIFNFKYASFGLCFVLTELLPIFPVKVLLIKIKICIPFVTHKKCY